jgi:hypothetical protein
MVTLGRRIHELCIQAINAKDTDDLQPIICELRDALHEHNDDLKLILAEYPFLLADLAKLADDSSLAASPERDSRIYFRLKN